MSTELLLVYFTLYLFLGILGMYGLFSQAIKKYEKNYEYTFSSMPFLYIFPLFAVASLSAFFINDLHDFIEKLTWLRITIPLLLAAIIFGTQFVFERMGQSLVIIACVAIDVYLQPIGIGNPFPQIPVWCLQLSCVVFFSIFCLEANILNSVPHTFILPNLITLFGICILTLIGAAPIYICLLAATLLGALASYLSFNFNSIKIELDSTSCSAIAFLIAHLMLLNLGEMCFSSYIILTMLFWSELAVALWNKLLFSQTSSLQENTNYYKIALNYNAQTVFISIMRAGLIIVLLSWFQLFSKNSYSLIAVSFLLALWLNNALGEPLIKKQKFREINQEFINNLKENIDETKKIITKRKQK